MKVNEDIRGELIDGLEKTLKHFIEDAKKNIGLINTADSVEEIMEYKRVLLLSWIGNVPLSTKECYFCIKTNLHCYNCEYAKVHKICGIDPNSDWSAIKKIKNNLIDVILNKYYKGEIYLESSKRKTIYCPNCNFKYRRVVKDNSYGLCKNCGETI